MNFINGFRQKFAIARMKQKLKDMKNNVNAVAEMQHDLKMNMLCGNKTSKAMLIKTFGEDEYWKMRILKGHYVPTPEDWAEIKKCFNNPDLLKKKYNQWSYQEIINYLQEESEKNLKMPEEDKLKDIQDNLPV